MYIFWLPLESALQATVQNIDRWSLSFIRWWEPVCWASEAAHGGQWSPTVCSSRWSRRLSSEPRALPPLPLPGQSRLDPEPAAYGHWHKTNIWHLKKSIKNLNGEEYWLFAIAVCLKKFPGVKTRINLTRPWNDTSDQSTRALFTDCGGYRSGLRYIAEWHYTMICKC